MDGVPANDCTCTRTGALTLGERHGVRAGSLRGAWGGRSARGAGARRAADLILTAGVCGVLVAVSAAARQIRGARQEQHFVMHQLDGLLAFEGLEGERALRRDAVLAQIYRRNLSRCGPGQDSVPKRGVTPGAALLGAERYSTNLAAQS
ncbi:hypothetical protein CERSUDRAFT_113092 [Gelatoporia subvermispora B]|uniref:Uncharacterized protein n=1 Tax=Ceriporiopsis subvermispora (strain B) TaxID=914234 RepID=M2RHJ7_CERS8|nr:hypothetical protein CERSUDRAFT_113092 [Gelatoporia subvermispora B]